MNVWILLTVAISLAQVAVADDFESCDTTKMMNCLLSMSDSQEKQRLFFPDTPEKLKEYCSHLLRGLDCANGFIDRCATEEEKQLYQNLTINMVGMNVDLCTDGSPLSTRFLTHVNCYKNLSDKFKFCSDRYIGNIVAVHGKPQQDQILMTCCTFHEYSQCMRNVVSSRCVKEAADLVEETVVKTLSTFLSYCKSDIPTTNCRKNFSAQHSLSSTTYGEDSGSGHHGNHPELWSFILVFLVAYFS